MSTTSVASRPDDDKLKKKHKKIARMQGQFMVAHVNQPYIYLLHLATAVSVRPPPPPSPLPPVPLSLLLSFSAVWRSQLLSVSSLCPPALMQSVASTTPRYHFVLFLAALGHKTVFAPHSEGKLSVDLSWLETPGGTLLDIGRQHVLVGLVLGLPHHPSPLR